jgi:inosine-uridine nucleoside N-ribohydrolase
VRLILDTDPGNGVPGADIDDGLAIALALNSPEVQLEAITVVAGNVPVDRGVACALEILEAAQVDDIPVHRGADRPLLQDPSAWRALLDDDRREDERAQRLWKGIGPRSLQTRPHPTPAAQALVEAVNAAPGAITLLAVGPLTNVATAMVLDPDLDTKLERLVVMGGAFDRPNTLQELNFSYDPEATHKVLTSRVPMVVVPLDVTMQTYLKLSEVEQIAQAGTPLADYLAETTRPWVQFQAERFDRDGCPLHDPLALAALLDPDVITTRTACADIELAGRLTRGRSVAWWNDADGMLTTNDLPDIRPVEIAYAVDNDRFLPLLLDRLCR